MCSLTCCFMLWEYGFLGELSQFPALRGLRSAPAENIWLWIPISMCLGQFSPRADIRFHESVASMPQSQKTVRTRSEGGVQESRDGLFTPMANKSSHLADDQWGWSRRGQQRTQHGEGRHCIHVFTGKTDYSSVSCSVSDSNWLIQENTYKSILLRLFHLNCSMWVSSASIFALTGPKTSPQILWGEVLVQFRFLDL